MHIRTVDTILLTGPCTNDPFLLEARKLRSVALVEITAEDRTTGVGETYAGYFCPEAVPAIVEFYAPILISVDILETPIETLWQRMVLCGSYWARVGLGAAVISGIEAALWDLKGKLLGVPVHELLGGAAHERLPAYATGGPSNWPPERLKAKMDTYLGLGFRALKVGAGYYDGAGGGELPAATREQIVETEAGKVAMMREYLGPEIGILLDGHMDNPQGRQWDVETASAVLKALEPYDLVFFEEPLPYRDRRGYAELRRATSVPLAGGECLTTVAEFRQFADVDALDIAQPDAAWVGGMREFLSVAELFAQRGQRVATHSWGAGVAQMQNIHAAFVAPNTTILELPPAAGPLHTELWGDAMIFRDGYVLPPAEPGLGVRLTDEIKARFPFVPGTGEFNSVPGKLLQT